MKGKRDIKKERKEKIHVHVYNKRVLIVRRLKSLFKYLSHPIGVCEPKYAQIKPKIQPEVCLFVCYIIFHTYTCTLHLCILHTYIRVHAHVIYV